MLLYPKIDFPSRVARTVHSDDSYGQSDDGYGQSDDVYGHFSDGHGLSGDGHVKREPGCGDSR